LYVFKRYLFEEVEAEVALAFDQLLFKLSDIVYAQFKVQAAAVMLDKNFKTAVPLLFPLFFLSFYTINYLL